MKAYIAYDWLQAGRKGMYKEPDVPSGRGLPRSVLYRYLLDISSTSSISMIMAFRYKFDFSLYAVFEQQFLSLEFSFSVIMPSFHFQTALLAHLSTA